MFSVPVKLGSVVDVSVGPGFWCYCGVAVSLLVAEHSFDFDTTSPFPTAGEEEADDEAQKSGEDGGEKDRFIDVAEKMQHRDSGGVARSAEKGRSAERYEAGISEQKIEADAVERIDHDLRCQTEG